MDPAHRNAVQIAASPIAPVGGGNDAHIVAAAGESQGEGMQKGAGKIAGAAGVIVGHEDDPHRYSSDFRSRRARCPPISRISSR